MLKVKNNPIYVAVIDFSASKCIRVKITSCSEWNEKLNEINATETRKRRIWGQSFTAHLISHTMRCFASWSPVSPASCNEQCNGPLVGLFACLKEFFFVNGFQGINRSFVLSFFILYFIFLSSLKVSYFLSPSRLFGIANVLYQLRLFLLDCESDN